MKKALVLFMVLQAVFNVYGSAEQERVFRDSGRGWITYTQGNVGVTFWMRGRRYAGLISKTINNKVIHICMSEEDAKKQFVILTDLYTKQEQTEK